MIFSFNFSFNRPKLGFLLEKATAVNKSQIHLLSRRKKKGLKNNLKIENFNYGKCYSFFIKLYSLHNSSIEELIVLHLGSEDISS